MHAAAKIHNVFPKRFVFFFFRGVCEVGVGIFSLCGGSFFLCIPGWPSSFRSGIPFLCRILAVLFALGVGLPYLPSPGWDPRSWGWSRWPSFCHLGLGFPVLLGVRLPSSGEGCPSSPVFAIGHSFLGGDTREGAKTNFRQKREPKSKTRRTCDRTGRCLLTGWLASPESLKFRPSSFSLRSRKGEKQQFSIPFQ